MLDTQNPVRITAILLVALASMACQDESRPPESPSSQTAAEAEEESPTTVETVHEDIKEKTREIADDLGVRPEIAGSKDEGEKGKDDPETSSDGEGEGGKKD